MQDRDMLQGSFLPTVFQSFDIRTSPGTVAPRLAALREEIARAGLDAFLIPRADAHRGESVPPGEARLAYVTSFTGSAGLAMVGLKRAALFVDSRYTLQAPAETDLRKVTVIDTTPPNGHSRRGEFVAPGGKVGYVPWLHTPGEIKELERDLAGRATLVPSENLVDRIWTDRPPAPVTPVEFLGDNRAGRSAADKLKELRATLAREHADAVVLTLPESICWLFNMRGRDVPNTPFVLGFAIVPKTGRPTFYVDRSKMTPELRKGLAGLARIPDVRGLVAAPEEPGTTGQRNMVEPATRPVALVHGVRQAG